MNSVIVFSCAFLNAVKGIAVFKSKAFINATDNFAYCLRNILTCFFAVFLNSAGKITHRGKFRCIRVNKAFEGFAFKSELFKQTKIIIDDTSTDPVYHIDFEKDGEYIITLEDNTDEDENTTQADNETDSDDCSRARFFPTTGGILKTMEQSINGYTYMAIDGVENCMAALRDIESGKIHKCFIEMSSCTGSCIGGPVMEKYHHS